jgi:hypothetical protein
METGPVCSANIGPRGRRKRLVWGIAMFALSLAIAAVLIATGMPREWRILLVLPLWAAALGVFQAAEST